MALGDLDRFRARHIDDSLRLVPLIDDLPAGPCADVGSGAGLPGIPVAIARPERTWRLIEPRRRRAAFLEEAVRELELDCEVVVATAAEAAARGADHALATARALAPPPRALEMIVPLVAGGGVAAVFVGAGDPIPPETEEWEEGIAIVRL